MLGSVISKRWVVSLALVGLVSVFMASYSAGWANPASAATTVSGEILTSLVAKGSNTGGNFQIGPNGQDIILSVEARNENGGTTLSPTITYLWSLSGSCGTLTGTTTDTATFNAGTTGGCTASISVHAQQDGFNQANGPTTTIAVSSPVVVVPEIVDPPPVIPPTFTPAAEDELVESLETLLVALSPDVDPTETNVEVVTHSTGGTLSLDSSSVSPVSGSISIPPLSFGTRPVLAVTIQPYVPLFGSGTIAVLGALDDAPVLTSAFAASTGGTVAGSFGTDISFYDIDGLKIENFRLTKPAEICLPYTAEDLDSAYRGIDGMAVWHLGESGWVRTNSSVDLNNKVVCGYSSTFSPFVIGLDVAPPETSDETGLPATGDYAPGYGNLMLVLMAGVALVATGGFAIRRSRRVREDS